MSSSNPATYARRPELNAVEMDGELVMMGQEQGEYFSLRDVAATIWKALDQPRSLEELTAQVSAEWNVAPEVCRPDIVAFLDELTTKKLVSVS